MAPTLLSSLVSDGSKEDSMTKRWIGMLAVAAAVAVMPSASMAQSVSIQLGRGSNYHGARDTYRIGFDRGFEDGQHRGARDADHRDRFDVRRGLNDDRGYSRSFGPRSVYSNGYREGYEQGYRRAYAYNRRGWVGKDQRWNDRDRDGDDRDRRYDDRRDRW